MKSAVLSLSLLLTLACASPATGGGGPQAGPFRTSADKQLQKDIVTQVQMIHGALHPECRDVKPTAAQVVEAAGTQAKRVVTEDWTMTGCGKAFIYRVQLMPSPQGGVDIMIPLGRDNPRVTAN